MQPNERYDLIMQMLSSQDMVTIPELMRTFDISIETARRDLNYLEKEKLIKKVYGGAILFNRIGSISGVSQRMVENIAEKEAIGRKCAELVHDGDTLFLGPGTTVLQVVKSLKSKKNLTVVTYSLYVATELISTDATVYFIGGRINNKDAHTEQALDRSWDFFCPPIAIIGASGVSSKYGVTDFEPGDSYIMREMLSRAANIILVADNSKFGLVHSCISCPISDVNRIVTGAHQKEDILQDFSNYVQRFLFVDDYPPADPSQR